MQCQQDQDWMGRQEEVSLVTSGSPSMHFQQRSWGTNQSSGDLKSDHIISRLGQSAQGSKGSRYLVHPLAFEEVADQTGLAPLPKPHLQESPHRALQPPLPGVHVENQYTASWLEALSLPKPGHRPSPFDHLCIPKGWQGRFFSIIQVRKQSRRSTVPLVKRHAAPLRECSF